MDSTELGVTATEDKPERQPQTAAGGKGGRRRGTRRIRGIGRLIREVVAELRKVLWPSRKELVNYTVVVLVFVTAMVLLVAGLDIAFAKGVLLVFG